MNMMIKKKTTPIKQYKEILGSNSFAKPNSKPIFLSLILLQTNQKQLKTNILRNDKNIANKKF